MAETSKRFPALSRSLIVFHTLTPPYCALARSIFKIKCLRHSPYCRTFSAIFMLKLVIVRSKIQGLGLYAARDLEKHTMVIEYIGEIIRSELSEIREKQYEAKVSS